MIGKAEQPGDLILNTMTENEGIINKVHKKTNRKTK